MTSSRVIVYLGDELARYGFGEDHPFGPDRHNAFVTELEQRGLIEQVEVHDPVQVGADVLERFHTKNYIERVKTQSKSGEGFLDCGDTPALIGIYEAACTVVGTTLAAIDRIIAGDTRRAFIPIAGLHHARRDTAAGFCVFNDCGVAIETLRQVHGIQRVAYVDIDAHHGDGVFYEFESDPDLIFVDFHEDGRYLYPGTGFEHETGQGAAEGTKLNISMPQFADDELLMKRWEKAEDFLDSARPEFILFQCGADSLRGDPITHLHYTAAAHAFVAKRLCKVADKYSQGRILALGGGGYNRTNLAKAWCAVVEQLIGE
jgi:acetoin utilization protein AcuC